MGRRAQAEGPAGIEKPAASVERDGVRKIVLGMESGGEVYRHAPGFARNRNHNLGEEP